MEQALYAPGLGYYSAGAVKFGPDGDFVTAPELSPLFSNCVARQCEEILEQAGGDTVLELGAGSGRLACDLLRELAARGSAPREYWILETSAELRDRQSRLLCGELPDGATRIRWLDRLPESRFSGAILANEVLDAVPVHRVKLSRDRIDELRVSWKNSRFAWHEQPADDALDTTARRILTGIQWPFPDGYVTEIRGGLAPLVASWAQTLDAGALLLLDYGYPRREFFHPQRRDGTLLCHYRHRVHSDPFLYPGLQDISAAVDFTAVAEAASCAGLDVCGFTTQAHFLIGCGLEEITARCSEGGTRARLEAARQVKLLTLPGEMGEQVKAIALGRQLPARGLAGFAAADQRQRL